VRRQPHCTILTTVDLDPQDGDVDLIEEVERAFSVKLEQADVGHWRTVGDVHETLMRRVLPSRVGACPSMFAFNVLRAALVQNGALRSNIRPSTLLESVAGHRPARLFRQFRKQTGLDLPTCSYRVPGQVGSIVILIASIITVVCLLTASWVAFLTSVVSLSGGLALAYSDKGRLPVSLRTFGDLAQRSAALSRGTLVARGMRDMPSSVWDTLAAILAELTITDPRAIGPDTYLFRKVCKAETRAA
jgi:hypothetical protein